MAITGSYQLVSSTNMDAFCQASGLSADAAEMEKSQDTKVQITETGNEIVSVWENSAHGKFEFKHNLDEEFTSAYDGRSAKNVFTRVGNNKLVQKQVMDNGFESTTEYEFTDEGMTTVMKWNGGTATQHYKRV